MTQAGMCWPPLHHQPGEDRSHVACVQFTRHPVERSGALEQSTGRRKGQEWISHSSPSSRFPLVKAHSKAVKCNSIIWPQGIHVGHQSHTNPIVGIYVQVQKGKKEPDIPGCSWSALLPMGEAIGRNQCVRDKRPVSPRQQNHEVLKRVWCRRLN